MQDSSDDKSIDIIGFGKVAKAIPPKVYEKTATTVLTTFEQLTAPLTEMTTGLGRYLRQKFDNMVEVEKAIATHTIEQALLRARAKAERSGTALLPPNRGPLNHRAF